MSLQKVNDMLKKATDKGYGIPAMNVFNYESIAWAIQAAEQEDMPIIVQFWPGMSSFIPMPVVVDIAKRLATEAKVPVGIHLDHSNRCEIAVEAMMSGFPSVMIDGSSLPYEENVALSAETVRFAHAAGVDVEAELGHVGSALEEGDLHSSNFTDPEQAAEFVRRTGVDSLAVAVGNGHGDYVRMPELDFELIKKLRKNVSVPLVMHGGSGIPTDQMQNAVRCGVSKFNIATEYEKIFFDSMKAYIGQVQPHQYYFEGLETIKEPCINFVRDKIRMLNPDHSGK
ncbi:class II fructose-bisphosphate aldolase [Novisyntrophococcus fermenticellae]|uniref:class II fructose-bisphosphate aldolase n=1 Tax=Novisyntrophococcus fermenticellae TaxID=2068655 RepID=UPI001E431CCF|nr:class II fructose-bisphosphate aldolase [Novisyntrophococcus fermenticellae]